MIELSNRDLQRAFVQYLELNGVLKRTKNGKRIKDKQAHIAQYWFLAGARTAMGGKLSAWAEIVHQSGRNMATEPEIKEMEVEVK